MKKMTILLSALFMILFLNNAHGQDTLTVPRYEYMTIYSVFVSNRLSEIFITEPNGEYQVLNISRNRKGNWQTTEILALLDKYNEKGWEVLSSNATHDEVWAYMYYFLRRKKE